MGRSDGLPIYLKSYQLLIEIYKTTGSFSREMKYTLGQDMKNDAMELMRHIFRANHHADKVKDLENFLSCFDSLRLQLRLARELNALSVRKLAHLSLMMEDISKQAHLWKRSAARKMSRVIPDEEKEKSQSHREEVNFETTG